MREAEKLRGALPTHIGNLSLTRNQPSPSLRPNPVNARTLNGHEPCSLDPSPARCFRVWVCWAKFQLLFEPGVLGVCLFMLSAARLAYLSEP